MNQNRSGFTVVELLISVVVLGTGLLALASGLGSITRTLHGSRISTEAVQLATQRMDRLRAASRSTTVPCTSTSFASSVSAITTSGVTQTWVVPATGALRTVLVIVTYPLGRNQTKTDTLATNISCS